MKITKYILSFTFLLVVLCAEAQQLRKEAFDLLNLDYPGLEVIFLFRDFLISVHI